MKNILLLILCCAYNNVFSQQLDIQETLNYIEKTENRYREDWSESIVKYTITEDGMLIQDEYRLDNIDRLHERVSVHFDDIIQKVGIQHWDDNDIAITCKNKNCFTFIQYRENKTMTSFRDSKDNWGKLDFVVRQEYEAKKMVNAINYLFSLIKNKKIFRDADDPFAESVISSNTSLNNKSEQVKLTDNNGTFLVNVTFKSLSIPFVLDSGAAEISISANVEKQLIQNGTITKNDYLPDGLYKLADGRIVSQKRVMLKNVTVGQFTVKNVSASVGGEETLLLLGKSFLDKFANWSIDNSTNTLELKI